MESDILDWKNAVEQAQRALRDGESQDGDSREVVENLSRVHRALTKISAGSVSRSNLQEAVRAVLLKILAEEKELLGTDASGDRSAGQAEEVAKLEGRVVELEGVQRKIRGILKQLTGASQGFQDGLDSVRSGVDGKDDVLRKKLRSDLSSLEKEFKTTLSDVVKKTVETLRKYDGKLAGELVRLTKRVDNEAALREEAALLAKSKDEALQGQIQDVKDHALQSVESRLVELSEDVKGLPSLFPSAEDLFERVEAQLASMDERFSRIEAEVCDLKERIPAWQNTTDNLEEIRGKITEFYATTSKKEKDIIGLRDRFFKGLGDVEVLLIKNVERRDMKQTLIHKRILDLRDRVREELELALDTVRNRGGSFWMKLAGKGDGGSTLTREELQHVRDVLEDVLEGLEFIIFENGKDGGIGG